MNRSKSHEAPYPSLKIVQKKDYWYKTSPKEKKKKKTPKISMQKSHSMDFEDHSEVDEVEQKVFKL